MTYLEKLFTERIENLKTHIIKSHCPRYFGYPDDDECPAQIYDPDACKRCWNREVVESEEV